MKGGGLCRTPASGPNTYLPTANHHTYKNKQKTGGPRALGRRRVPARHHRVRPLPDGQGWLGRQPRRVRVRQPARPGGGLRVYGHGRGLRVVPRAFCVRGGRVCVRRNPNTTTHNPQFKNAAASLGPATAVLPPHGHSARRGGRAAAGVLLPRQIPAPRGRFRVRLFWLIFLGGRGLVLWVDDLSYSNVPTTPSRVKQTKQKQHRGPPHLRARRRHRSTNERGGGTSTAAPRPTAPAGRPAVLRRRRVRAFCLGSLGVSGPS